MTDSGVTLRSNHSHIAKFEHDRPHMHPNLMNFDADSETVKATRPRFNCWNIFKLFKLGRAARA